MPASAVLRETVQDPASKADADKFKLNNSIQKIFRSRKQNLPRKFAFVTQFYKNTSHSMEKKKEI